MRSLAAVAAIGVVSLAGCAGGPSAGTGNAVVTGPVQLDERANGTTVDVDLGQTVIVTLHSTYWRIEIPTRALQPVGEPQTSPSPCAVTGGGCGTVTQNFNAAKVDTTTVHAHRDSCGEAIRCTGKNADWSVTVRVH